MHVLILGQTMCGKSTLAKHLAQRSINRGRPVLLFDPIGDPKFPATWRTNNADHLAARADREYSCTLILDEAGAAVDRYAADERFALITRSRHRGHTAIVIAQRFSQISPLVRDQCAWLYLFRCGSGVARTIEEEFAAPGVGGRATELGPYECLRVDRYGNIEERSVAPY